MSGNPVSLVRWLCVVLVVCVSARSSEGFTKYCGAKLTEALALFCPGGFAHRVKKSIEDLDDYVDYSDQLTDSLRDWPLLSRIASSAMMKSRRKRFGIVNECCAKHCTKSQIMAYCY